MERTAPEQRPPGVSAYLQGYMAAAIFGAPRVAPQSHPGHTDEWRVTWLRGYDAALIKAAERKQWRR